MKKLACAMVYAFIFSSTSALPAVANSGSIALCRENPAPPCIQSVSLKGAGIVEWFELSTFSRSANGSYSISTANSAYAPESGYGKDISVSASGWTSSTSISEVFVTATNDLEQTQAFGTYRKNLDPRTEVKVMLNTGEFSFQNSQSSNLAKRSVRVFSFSDANNYVSISGQVTKRAISQDGNSQGIKDWNAPAKLVEDGILIWRANLLSRAPEHFSGMSIDTNAQEYSAPYVLEEVLGVPSIHYLVAAPHLLTDGATLNSGYYSSVLPANFLHFYGLTQESVIQNNVELTANYLGSTEILNSVVTAEPNGAVRITAEVFHYSKPTLITKFRGLPQSAKVGSAVKKGKKLSLPLKSTQGIATSWKSSSPNFCKVTSTKKTTKKKVGKKTVKTVTITKWQVQGKKKGTCTVVGTNAGNGSFGPANISKSIIVN